MVSQHDNRQHAECREMTFEITSFLKRVCHDDAFAALAPAGLFVE
jgi:hypothetical protein